MIFFRKHSRWWPAICLGLLLPVVQGRSQVLTIQNAIDTAMANYGTIKAKAAYMKSAAANQKEVALQYLPDLALQVQQAFGNANGQFGPGFPGKVFGISSAGPSFPNQSWHSTFGSLYLTSVNWDFFTFGRVAESNKIAASRVSQQSLDLEQEKFQQSIRVAAAYLNLLAAQRLRITQQKNLERATALRNVVLARTKNGLNAGVDSSLANAEVSNARTQLTNALDYETELSGQLAQMMGVGLQSFTLDTLFLNKVPLSVQDTAAAAAHPLLKFYQSRIDISREQEKYYSRFKYPVLSLFGAMQSRGSGFADNYSALNPSAYSHDYWTGIQPTRTNYVLGLGMAWNVTNFIKTRQQVALQHFTSEGLQEEYNLLNQQLQTQQSVAAQKIKNALANYAEAPVQMKAASDAYLQKSVLYKNGLATIVDITQALFTLNRAETTREIANNNVWQALLLQSAAAGDIEHFLRELK